MPTTKAPPSDHPLILDAHTHLGAFRNFHIPQNDAHGMVAAMDSYGIDMIVTAAHAGISSDYRAGNDEVIAAADLYPDRILGHCCINPNYPAEIRAELERCFAHPSMRGIKLHPELHGDYPLDGPAYEPVWEYAAAHAIPVLSHSYFGGDPLEVFGTIAARYPTVPVIVGHGGIDQGWQRACAVASEHSNIWLDLAGPAALDGMVETYTRTVGADRLLFGTDMPFMNGGLQLGAVLYAQLERQQIARIVGLNAAGIFGVETAAGNKSPELVR